MLATIPWKSIPNILTLFRVLVIPLLVACLSSSSATIHRFALLLFILAALTDIFDGVIARRWEVVTDFGKLLDPLADKVLVMTALVMLVAMRVDGTGESMVPGWLVVSLLAREFWVTGLRGAAAARGLVIAASDGGKLKTVLQMVGICFLIVGAETIPIGGYVVPSRVFGLNLVFLSLFYSLASAYRYTLEVFSLYRVTSLAVVKPQFGSDEAS